MGNQDFKTAISAMVPADEVSNKINNISQWWGISFEGRSAKRDDIFTVKMGGESFFEFTVAELIPGQRTVWLVNDCNMPWYSDKKEWANTRLIFDLTEKNGTTEITFTHEGLTPKVECYKDCEPGWRHWIETSLLSYLTTGTGVFRAPTI